MQTYLSHTYPKLDSVNEVRPLTLARKYMDIFFSGTGLERLSNIFAKDLGFSGPFHQFSSAQDYIDSLKSDPPQDCEYQIIREFEDGGVACLIYEFSKRGVRVPMAQLFEIRDGKISRILLIFDSSRF